MDVHLLYKQLGSVRAVARQTGYSRNTVRKMLRTGAPPAFRKPVRKTGVDEFKEYLTSRFTEHGLSAERLLVEIRAQGFAGSIHMVRRFLRKLRPMRAAVERMVDYVKDNFLLARQFADLEDLNGQATAWLDHTANARLHATTGHRPVDLLKSEIEHLTPIESVRPYTFIERHPRKVAKESMVSFNSSRYSVPPAYVGRDVTVELSGDHGTIVIRSGDAIVAEHPAAPVRLREALASEQRLEAVRV